MERFARVCLPVLTLLLTTCYTLPPPSSGADEIKMGTVAQALKGEWFVGEWQSGEDVRHLGTLTIDGNDYTFQPMPQAEIPSWMQERFSFIDKPVGAVTFEYEPGVLPDNDIQNFEDHAILATCQFNDQEEVYFIRVDHSVKQLYFHSTYSEFQIYVIRKESQ
jgi:hypothetical protein